MQSIQNIAAVETEERDDVNVSEESNTIPAAETNAGTKPVNLPKLLTYMREKKASDLHLVAGQPPLFRIDGEIVRRENDAVLDSAIIEQMFLPHFTSEQRRRLDEQQRDVDTTLRNGDRRFRTHIFRDSNGLGAAIRIIPNQVWTLEDLGILQTAPVIQKLTNLKRGLVIVTGTMGSGKTTTCAGMIEEINRTRAERIITFEDPLEYEFQSKKSLISQRAVGEDIANYPEGLRAAMYMDPDVIVLDRLRDLETIMMAMTAAETGHLIFATMNVPSASEAIQRLIDSWPEGQRLLIRDILSRNLQAVIAQMLLPRASTAGRVACHEILIATPRVREMIRLGATDFTLAMEANRNIGMQTMDDGLAALAEQGIITPEMAKARMTDSSRLKMPESSP